MFTASIVEFVLIIFYVDRLNCQFNNETICMCHKKNIHSEIRTAYSCNSNVVFLLRDYFMFGIIVNRHALWALVRCYGKCLHTELLYCCTNENPGIDHTIKSKCFVSFPSFTLRISLLKYIPSSINAVYGVYK